MIRRLMKRRDAGDESEKIGSEVGARAAATEEGRKRESTKRAEGETILRPMTVVLIQMTRTQIPLLLTTGGTRESTDGVIMTERSTNAKEVVIEKLRAEIEKENVVVTLKGEISGAVIEIAMIEEKMGNGNFRMTKSMQRQERDRRIESVITRTSRMFASYHILLLRSHQKHEKNNFSNAFLV
mmetsp:Transcript_11696/g.23566  ORF Transcript_11696/g.23566 Transcript_11696/m.23566 type:complete len:183 (+) Transcript_11696:181-729(+)